MREEWKQIKWYEWLYEVSNLWYIRNSKYYNMKSRASWRSWARKIELSKDNKKKTFYLHRLIAQAFLGLDINNVKISVWHKDYDNDNNCVDNLFIWDATDIARDMISKWKHSTQKKRKEKVIKWYNIENFDRFDNYNDWFIYI